MQRGGLRVLPPSDSDLPSGRGGTVMRLCGVVFIGQLSLARWQQVRARREMKLSVEAQRRRSRLPHHSSHCGSAFCCLCLPPLFGGKKEKRGKKKRRELRRAEQRCRKLPGSDQSWEQRLTGDMENARLVWWPLHFPHWQIKVVMTEQ